ncbi:MAG: autotransporter domain-containing protein [Alphaproteobacteria bacterium]|nr:autotransporter domain-containing protein [Alphaproteobacteria bacterium]
MRYSNTALKELSKRYRHVLIKCAMLNAAALIAFATPAMADSINYKDGSTYEVKTDFTLQNTAGKSYSLLVQSPSTGTNGNYDGTQFSVVEAKNVDIKMVGGNLDSAAIWVQTRSAFSTLPNDHSRVDITADNINISATDSNALIAMSNGVIDLDGNTVLSGGNIILARGYAQVNINADNTDKTAQLTGNIDFNYEKKTSNSTVDAAININLNGANSFWKGNTLVSWDNGIAPDDQTKLTVSKASVTLNDGALWEATTISRPDGKKDYYQIALNNLTVNKGTINVASGATAMVEKATIKGDLTLNGTLTTVEGHTVTFENGSTLTTTLDSSTVKFDGDGKVAGTINLTSLSAGTYAFMGENVDHSSLSFADNALYDIALDGDNLVVTTKAADSIAEETGASQQETSALVAMVAADGTGTEKGQLVAAALSEAMQSGNSAVAVEAAKQAAPTTAQVVVGVAKEAANTVAKLSTNRLDGLKGRAGGDVLEGAGLWMQALYNHTKQDSTSTSDGFKANSRGLAIGVDKEVTDTTVLGIGYGYMNTDVDSYGRDLEVDGHNFFVYGKYQPSKWYVSSVLNYNYSRYTEKKTPLGISLRSEYDVNSYGAQLMTGYDMDNGITPEVGLRYLVVDADSYNDGMQRVRSDKDDVLTAVAGIKYSTDIKSDGIVFKPTARLAATYDVVSDNSRANVSVIGGNSYSVDGERLHRFGVEAGAGVTASVDNIDITLEYTGAFRQDYKSQGGMLRARYNF